MGLNTNSKNYQVKLIENIYNKIPAFTDVFTEETFYTFAMCFALSTILLAFIMSKFVTIKPVD